jgi:glycine/D-amino acid oxidase-like deaminating enzyme
VKSEKEDILIIGAGVIGLSIALSLQDQGYKITLVDANCSWKASSAAAGVLFPTSAARSSGRAGYYSFKALEAWPEFEKRLGGNIRQENGIVFIENEDGLDDLKTIAKNGNLNIEDLKTAPKYLQPTKDENTYVVEIKNGSVVNPRILIESLKNLLRADFKNDLVNSLIIKNDLVIGVEGKNDKYFADKIIVATGANGFGWLPSELRPKLIPTQGEALLLKIDKSPSLPSAIYPFREGPLIDYGQGNLWLGGSYYQPKESGASFLEIERIIKTGKNIFPWIKNSRINKIVYGIRPVSPDGLPFIGPSKISNLYIASGHGKDGILHSALVGKQISSWVTDNKGDRDLLPTRRS